MDCFIENLDSGQLFPFVQKYILVKKLNSIQEKLLDFKTTGNVFLVFLYKGAITLKYQKKAQYLEPECYIVGQVHREQIQFFFHEKTEVILIELNPVALSHLVKESLNSYTNKVTPINLHGTKVLFKEISEMNDVKLKIKLISGFLKVQLPVQKIISDNVFKLTKWIDRQDEKITVDQIADYLHCCERQVERIFQKKIGVSPKFYLKCVQMRQIINMVMDKGDRPLIDILFEKGHYDASHFHKDFKRVMKMTPIEFFNEEVTFAKQIMRL